MRRKRRKRQREGRGLHGGAQQRKQWTWRNRAYAKEPGLQGVRV